MSPSKPSIQLLTRANGAGLSRDLTLMAQILRQHGWTVTVTKLSHRSRLSVRLIRLRRWIRRCLHSLFARQTIARYDINLMLERVYPERFEQARRNVLMPNPEWTRAQWLPSLPAFDLVAAKTHHAVALFERLGCRVRWTGFIGDDRQDHWPRCMTLTMQPWRLPLPNAWPCQQHSARRLALKLGIGLSNKAPSFHHASQACCTKYSASPQTRQTSTTRQAPQQRTYNVRK